MTVTGQDILKQWGAPSTSDASLPDDAPNPAQGGGAPPGPTDFMADQQQQPSPLGPSGPTGAAPSATPTDGSDVMKAWGPKLQDTSTATPADQTTPEFESKHPWAAAALRVGTNMAQGFLSTYRGAMSDEIPVKRDAQGNLVTDKNGNPINEPIGPSSTEKWLSDIRQRYAAEPKTLGNEIETWVERFVGGLGLPTPGGQIEGMGANSISPDIKLSRALRAAGAKLNPEENPEAGVIGKSIQRAAGMRKTEWHTSKENIDWADDLIRKHFRLEESTPINSDTMDAVIDGAGHAYDRARAIPAWIIDEQHKMDAIQFGSKFMSMVASHPKLYDTGLVRRVNELRSLLLDENWDGESAIETSKTLRASARQNLTGGTLKPMAWLEGSFENQAAGIVENALGRAGANNGDAQLIQRIQESRTTIAQAYDLRGSIVGDHVSPARLARLQRLSMSRAGRSAGRAPLSGALRLIADGALRFPRSFLSASESKEMSVGEVGSLMQMIAGAGLVSGHYSMIALMIGRVGAQSAVKSGAVYLNPYTDTEIMKNAVRVAQGIAKANPVAITLAMGGASASPTTWPQDPLIALFAPIIGRDEAAKLAQGASAGTAVWAGAKMLKHHEPELTKSMWEAQEFSEAVQKESGGGGEE